MFHTVVVRVRPIRGRGKAEVDSERFVYPVCRMPVGTSVRLYCRSDTMEGYLRCMKVADLAIEAQVMILRGLCHASFFICDRALFCVDGCNVAYVLECRDVLNWFDSTDSIRFIPTDTAV